ncbi:AAA family ATPase [Zavarzinia compransoris]|uniref:bifunctional aminoglycoside phosphotransferase/ATP-binding protein n=1 Tax=Zavarzinia marina TaxID=2911065 RepID=UPI001F3D052F|nr:bifunctional aminoglycoside phosphotransferase/ATP-binding protein [Zavarzinia marina]MCF4164076.1 AAA family ATPase [Zavarzinia marina]
MHDEIIAFLADPATHGGAPVRRIDTSCAHVFLAGERAFKIKRPVDLGYLNFATMARREAACAAELRLNRMTAPELYLGLSHVTRAADGTLALDGPGEAVEPVVVMRRFPDDALATTALADGRIDAAMIADLGLRLARFHRDCPVPPIGPRPASRLLESCLAPIRAMADVVPAARLTALVERLVPAFEEADRHVTERAAQGWWRRFHGDLHLGNIALIDGRLVPFDALEFDDALATGDVLYDLAFLVMDLGRRDRPDLALSLFESYGGHGPGGARLMPAFVALRAAIRAFVAHAAWHGAPKGTEAPTAEIGNLLAIAEAALSPAPPRLIAVGGLSGTGKTTVARALAPHVGLVPGALHLRTDVIRKRLGGVAETERLPPEAYTPDASDRVYAAMAAAARAGLAEGRSVIVDAVFARPGERADIAALWPDFTGIWLDLPLDARQARIGGRRDDASDATAEVAARQESYDLGPIDWHRLPAGGPIADLAAAARRLL